MVNVNAGVTVIERSPETKAFAINLPAQNLQKSMSSDNSNTLHLQVMTTRFLTNVADVSWNKSTYFQDCLLHRI
ncbi:hypothetical protein JOB18_025100 [Solea senegalensis]|uniref:Uncharacterized protein n=1 Tax=Solea senegalensis TaxID=28829 RepID=A0AAV6R9N7_SOLSE|nr:hypothetical protein JOB18_025100 [Solea senegalensis]